MSSRRVRADEFEDVAAERVVEQGLDPTTYRAMFGVFRLGARMFNDLETEVHRPAGWSLAGFRVMFILWVLGPTESHEIARLAGLSRAAISSAVNTLERDGLVDRRRESADRRVVTVYLTPDGQARLVAAYTKQNERERVLFGGLSNDELMTLTDLMRRISSVRLDSDEVADLASEEPENPIS